MAISDKYLPGNLNRDEMDTIKGIPKSIFNNLSSEEQSQILGGNLNRAEMDQLQESEPGSFSEIRGMIGELLAAGAPVSRFNQGGIVSLRRLTRPLGY